MAIPSSQFYYNRKVLVTGGAGFIGSRVVSHLLAAGAQVTVLDDLSTGSLKAIEHLSRHLTFIEGTITDPATCLEAANQHSIIIHLAAMASVPASCANPEKAHAINVTGTCNMLEAARHIDSIQRFLFASSSAVYGNCTTACNEDTPCAPLSPYGFSKHIGEIYLKQYAQIYGLNTLSLRFFNVVDTETPAHLLPHAGVVAQWRYKFARREPICMWGDGNQTRDFVPVTFIAQTLLKLATLPDHYWHGDVINIASGKNITLNSLFQELKKEFPDYNLLPHYAPARPGDIYHSIADCKKLFTLLHGLN